MKTTRMKNYKYWAVLFFTITALACNKDDREFSEADFSVLGITSITINNKIYSVKDNLLLELDESQHIVLSGIQMTESTKHAVIDYSVIRTTQETPEVSATSRYMDVAVLVNCTTTTNEQTCVTLDICRNGKPEQITYKFYFSNI